MSPMPRNFAHHKQAKPRLTVGRPLDEDQPISFATKKAHIHCPVCASLIEVPYVCVSPVPVDARVAESAGNYPRAEDGTFIVRRVSFAASDLGIGFEGLRYCPEHVPAPVLERAGEFVMTRVSSEALEMPGGRHFSDNPVVLGSWT